MITIMNQVTCSPCNKKTDEPEWMYHQVLTNNLQLCKQNEDKIAILFFEKIFNTYSNKSEIYNFLNLKNT